MHDTVRNSVAQNRSYESARRMETRYRREYPSMHSMLSNRTLSSSLTWVSVRGRRKAAEQPRQIYDKTCVSWKRQESRKGGNLFAGPKVRLVIFLSKKPMDEKCTGWTLSMGLPLRRKWSESSSVLSIVERTIGLACFPHNYQPLCPH